MLRGLSRRSFTSCHQSDDCKLVQIPCASSGSITLSLHNVAPHSETTPLLVYLPPSSRPTEVPSPLPRFARPYPTVVINYRWPGTEGTRPALGGRPGWRETDGDSGPAPGPAGAASAVLHWPTPLHDVLFGYRWIAENLAPETTPWRDIYVYGSYLGASLAAALALTECDQAIPMPVRGVALHNGIYDWTTFLPGHPINRPLPQVVGGAAPAGHVQSAAAMERLKYPVHAGKLMGGDEGVEPTFRHLKTLMPILFSAPSNLFDPFASPCLFFHTPGFEMPPTFDRPFHPDPDRGADEPSLGSGSDETEDRTIEIVFKTPRLGYETFPPRGSSLRIPAALLLHQSPTAVATGAGYGRAAPELSKAAAAAARRRRRLLGGMDSNGFASQAGRLASLMRRSVKFAELEGTWRWDEDLDAAEEKAAWRVRLRDVGPAALGDEAVEKPVAEWLKEQMGF